MASPLLVWSLRFESRRLSSPPFVDSVSTPRDASRFDSVATLSDTPLSSYRVSSRDGSSAWRNRLQSFNSLFQAHPLLPLKSMVPLSTSGVRSTRFDYKIRHWGSRTEQRTSITDFVVITVEIHDSPSRPCAVDLHSGEEPSPQQVIVISPPRCSLPTQDPVFEPSILLSPLESNTITASQFAYVELISPTHTGSFYEFVAGVHTHQQLAFLPPQLPQPLQRSLTIVNLNARPHFPHRKDVDAMLLSFDAIKFLWIRYGNAKVQRFGSVKTSALPSHIFGFSVYVKVNSSLKTELSIVYAIVAHQLKDEVSTIYSLWDSHSPVFQVRVKSRQLGLSHQDFCRAKQYQLNLYFLVIAGLIVQECCFVSVTHDYLTVASPTHYAVSSIDGSSQSRFFIPSQIGPCFLNVAYGSGASHQKLLPVNIATWSLRCFNVVFDYQLFERTIAMGTKVELLFGFLHFAELDSPRYGSISSCLVLFSSFILPLSMPPGISASVVNYYAF